LVVAFVVEDDDEPDCVQEEGADEDVAPKRTVFGVLGVVGVDKDGKVLVTDGEGEEKLNAEVATGVFVKLDPPNDEAVLAGVPIFPNVKALVVEGAGDATFSEAFVEPGVDPLSKE